MSPTPPTYPTHDQPTIHARLFQRSAAYVPFYVQFETCDDLQPSRWRPLENHDADEAGLRAAAAQGGPGFARPQEEGAGRTAAARYPASNLQQQTIWRLHTCLSPQIIIHFRTLYAILFCHRQKDFLK